jgi:hypothetical protein
VIITLNLIEIFIIYSFIYLFVMEELHTDSIDGGHEGQLWARSRVRERAYSNTPTRTLTGSGLGLC